MRTWKLAAAAAVIIAGVAALLLARAPARPLPTIAAPLALTGGFGPAASFAPRCSPERDGFAGLFLRGASSFQPRDCEEDSERLTITVNHLETASNTSTLTSFTTGSIAPTANCLILVSVLPTTATAGPPTVTGNGITYESVNTVSSGARRLSVLRGMSAAPSAGAVTLDFGGVSIPSVGWSISEFCGVDQSGTNGSGAVVQSITGVDAAGTATTLTTTLAALEHANNVHAASVGLSLSSTVTPDAEFAEIADDNEVGNNLTLETEWAANQVACTPTFLAAIVYMVSVEVKAG